MVSVKKKRKRKGPRTGDRLPVPRINGGISVYPHPTVAKRFNDLKAAAIVRRIKLHDVTFPLFDAINL